MKFYCFPKKQKLFLVYSSYQAFRSKIFNNFIIQSSPKNSLFFRLLKTDIGFIMRFVFKLEIDVPNKNSDFVGIIKNGRIILIELHNNQPFLVWRKNGNWKKEKFIGYQLISEYTNTEFRSKQKLIEQAFALHWKELDNSPTEVHGDFTHFNILVDNSNRIHFIDNKKHVNSKLFDFFYFYAYLKQSIYRCVTLSDKERRKIILIIEEIIKKTCLYSSKKSLNEDFNKIIIPDATGLINNNIDTYLNDFIKIFQD